MFLNMGGPDSLESVRPFLYNLFSDREIIVLGPSFLQRPIAWWIAKKRAPKSMAAYEKIGGKSPIASITKEQAKKTEESLKKMGLSAVCEPGMRYWNPRTPDVLKSMKEKGIRNIISISMYPHYSRATSGSSIKECKDLCKELDLRLNIIESYPDHPLYIAALKDTFLEGMNLMLGNRFSQPHPPLQLPSDCAVLYSAHNLPKSFIDEGDPYLNDIKKTIALLEKETGVKGHLSFQSKSGPVTWLEPTTDISLKDLADKGKKRILVLPISFVSDHIETLYEIDMLYGGMMEKMGARLFRTPSLNTRPSFIHFLSTITYEKIMEAGWQEQ
jgi:ferrochelatase